MAVAPIAADPWTALFSAGIGAAAGGPSTAKQDGNAASITMDGAGWTVATGQAKADGATMERAPAGSMGGTGGAGLMGGLDMNMLLLIIGAVVLVKVLK